MEKQLLSALESLQAGYEQ
ncbi:MbeD/MobD family mobilization/exclusion protein, partial [Pectobacterium atrosepticum]